MNGKTLKRTLALLLSVMITMMAFPVGGLAAEAEELAQAIANASIAADATDKDVVNLQMMAAKALYLGDGTKAVADTHTGLLDAYKKGNSTAASTYKYQYDNFALNDPTTYSDADLTTVQQITQMANQLFKDECEDGVLEVSPGDTVYIGVNIDTTGVTRNAGIANIGVSLDFDTSKLTFEGNKSNVILNNIDSGIGRDSALEGATPDAFASEYYDYLGDYTIGEYSSGNENGGLSVIAINTQDVWYMPVKHTTWDILIPVTVKDDATGTTVIGFNKRTTGHGTISIPMSADSNGTTGRNAISGSIAAGTVGQVGDNAGETTINANAIVLNIVKRSESPVEDPETFNPVIRDVKNMPYVSEEAAADPTALNDTITIPETGSKFASGDMVMLYADAEHTQELGGTVLCRETLVSIDGSGKIVTATSADETDFQNNGPSGHTFRLSRYKFTQTTDDPPVRSAVPEDGQGNGYGYLKGEKKVYLARLAAADIADPEYQPSGEVIEIVPESTDSPIYYHGNINVMGEENGSSDEKRIQVKFGSTVKDLIDSLGDRVTGTVQAPIEDGSETYEPTAGWTKKVDTKLITAPAKLMTAPATAPPNGEGGYTKWEDFTSGTGNDMYFDHHGKLNLILPYDKSSDSDRTYEQPSGSTYGAEIFVEVVPEETDYFFAKTSAAAADQYLIVYGKTADHFEADDFVGIWEDVNGAKGDQITTVNGGDVDTEFEGKPAKKISGTENVQLVLPNAGDFVWVTAYEKDTDITSSAVRVQVTDGSPDIASDVLFNEGKPYSVAAGSTLQGVLEEALPIDIPLLGTAAKGQAVDANAADILTGAVIKKSVWNAASSSYDEPTTVGAADFEGAGEKDKFEITKVIDSTLLTKLYNNTPTVAQYKNTNNRSFKLSAVILKPVVVTPPSGQELQVTDVVNNPLGKDDTFEITNVAYPEDIAANPLPEVNAGVRIYKDYDSETKVFSNEIGRGKIVSIDGPETPAAGDIFTLNCAVDQLGRDAGTVYVRIFGDGADTLATTDAIELTNVDEKYTFLGLDSYADPLKVKKGDGWSTYEDVYGAVTAPVLKYAYLIKNDANEYVADPNYTYTKTLTSGTDFEWTDEHTDGTSIDDFFTTGANASKVSLMKTDFTSAAEDTASVEANAAKAGVAIDFPASNPRTATTHIKFVTETLGEETENPTDVAAIQASVSLTNNAHPVQDTINVVEENKLKLDGIVMKLYRTQSDAESALGEIYKQTFTNMATAPSMNFPIVVSGDDTATYAASRAILGTMGGKLWVTYEDADTLATAPVELSYSTEPYIVRSSSVDTSKLGVINPTLLTEAADTTNADQVAATKESLISKLPKLMYAEADHLEGASPYTAIAAENKDISMTISGWAVEKADGTPSTTDAEIAEVINAAVEKSATQSATITMRASFDPATLPDAIKVNNEGTDETVPVVTTLTGVTTTDFNVAKFNVVVAQSGATDPVLTLPEGKTSVFDTDDSTGKPYVGITFGTEEAPEVNDGDPTNDQVSINFNSLTGDAKTNIAGSTVTLNYTDPDGTKQTYTGTLSDSGTLDIAVSNDENGFKGFNTANETKVTVQFSKTGCVSSGEFEATIPAVVSDLTVSKVISPRTIHMAAGTITTNEELVSYLDGVAKVSVNFASTDNPATGELPLVKNSENKVVWTLQKSNTQLADITGDASGLTPVEESGTKLGSVALGQATLADIKANSNTASIAKYYNAQGEEMASYTPTTTTWAIKTVVPNSSATIDASTGVLDLDKNGIVTTAIMLTVTVDGVTTEIPISASSETIAPKVLGKGGWADELAEYTDTAYYYMTAEVKTSDGFGENSDNKPVKDTNLLAIVPITLYNNQETDASAPGYNKIQMTEGNSDLYHNPTADGPAAVLAQTGTTAADHKYDLVYFYLWEGYRKSESIADPNKPEFVPEYVAEYMEPEPVSDAENAPLSYAKAIASVNGKDIDTWLTENENATVSVSATALNGQYGSAEVNTTQVDGKDIIQPNMGATTSDYFVSGGEIKRGIEKYKITYTITNGNDIYKASRNVKLTYMPGDTNMDGRINTGDAGTILQTYVGSTTLFKVYDVPVDNLNLGVQDLSRNNRVDTGDSGLLLQWYVGARDLESFHVRY